MKFVRFGTLTRQKQVPGIAPAKKGIWAFPHGCFDSFFLSSTKAVSHPSQKSRYLRDRWGDKILADDFFSSHFYRYLAGLKKIPNDGNYRACYYDTEPSPKMLVLPKEPLSSKDLEKTERKTQLRNADGDIVSAYQYYCVKFQYFGLSHRQREALAARFPEWKSWLEDPRRRDFDFDLSGYELKKAIEEATARSPELKSWFEYLYSNYDHSKEAACRDFKAACRELGFKPGWRNAQPGDVEPEYLDLLRKRKLDFSQVVPAAPLRLIIEPVYVATFNKPKIFEYNGLIWTRLVEYVKRSDILDERYADGDGRDDEPSRPVWILVTTKTFEKALRRLIETDAFQNGIQYGDRFYGAKTEGFNVEVFIEEKI
ncbi:MAG: hypothetical protein IJZ10_01205 [Thermoguttaceae bacterium]|nr:hypothetical protein [Thermoguttaceae bacterium]